MNNHPFTSPPTHIPTYINPHSLTTTTPPSPAPAIIMATMVPGLTCNNHHLHNWKCWFCEKCFIGFSGILGHWEEGRCVKYGRIRELVFETPEYAWCANKLTDQFPFFCYECQAHFQQISHVYYHVERSAACQHLLDDTHCLGALKKFILEYYHAEGTDGVDLM